MTAANLGGLYIWNDKDAPIFEMDFLLFDPETNSAVAGVRFNDQVLIVERARPEWSSRYYTDLSLNQLLNYADADSYIQLHEEAGYEVIYDSAREISKGFKDWTAEAVKEKLNFGLWYGGAIDPWLVSFILVDDTVVEESDRSQQCLKWFHEVYTTRNNKVPEYCDHMTIQDIQSRVHRITVSLFPKIKNETDKIDYPFPSLYSSSLRFALHYAVRNNYVSLVSYLSTHYNLNQLEPITGFLIRKVMTSPHQEIQKFFLEDLSYEEFPWEERMDHMEKRMQEPEVKNIIREKCITPEGQELFKRYYQETT